MLIGFGISPSRVKVTGGAVAFDADAEAFFTAASITDSTQKSAVNQLVLDLKSYNIWTKMTALYPIVGGSASSHAVNLKTPGTYNLTFATGVTHSSTGMVGNGSTGYANTNLSTSTIGLNSGHLSFYSRTNNTSQSCEIGGGNSSPNSYTTLELLSAGQGGVTVFRYNNTDPLNSTTISDTRGFFVGSRTASNVIKLFRNSSNIINGSAASNATSTRSQFILGYNNNTIPIWYSNKQCAFASIGTGLTDTEADNFYTAVQAYQTTLSRNV